jgi:hypothetical protein
LFKVTVRLVVDAALLLIVNELTVGLTASFNLIVSLDTADSPIAFLTLK